MAYTALVDDGEEFPSGQEIQDNAARTAEAAYLPSTARDSLEQQYNNQMALLEDLKAQRLRADANTSITQRTLQGQEEAVAPLRQGVRDALGARTAAAENLAAQPIPQIAQPPKLANFLNREAATSMAAIATLIAGFNSNGRIRGIRANQSLAAGLDGFMNGNLTVAKLGLEDWKNQVEQQLTEFKLIRQQNLDILNAKGMTIEQKLQEIQLAQAPYQNQLLQARVEKEGIDGVIKIDKDMAGIIQATEQSLIKADPAMRALNLQYRQSQIDVNKARMANLQASGGEAVLGIPFDQIPATQPGQKNEAFLGMLPPAQQEIVRRMAKGDLPASGLGGMGVKDRGQYIKAAAIYDPAFNARNYGVLDKAAKELTPGGRVGSNVVAINTLAHHIDDFAEQFAKLNNSQMQIWNRTKNKLSTEFGDPALQRLKVPAGLSAAELARIVKGGNAAPSEEEIKYWEGVFDTASSPEQARQVVWQALQGVGGRLKALEDAERQYMGPNYSVITPDARALILKNKPKNVPTPSWLAPPSGGSPSAGPSASGGQPAGGQVLPGKILVRDRATGRLGTVSENYYNLNPNKYERMPDGAPIQINDGAY